MEERWTNKLKASPSGSVPSSPQRTGAASSFLLTKPNPSDHLSQQLAITRERDPEILKPPNLEIWTNAMLYRLTGSLQGERRNIGFDWALVEVCWWLVLLWDGIVSYSLFFIGVLYVPILMCLANIFVSQPKVVKYNEIFCFCITF